MVCLQLCHGGFHSRDSGRTALEFAPAVDHVGEDRRQKLLRSGPGIEDVCR